MNAPAHVLPAPLPSAPLAEMVNHTRHPAQYFQHVDNRGGVFHVVVARLTYDLSALDPSTVGKEVTEPPLTAQQPALVDADRWDGDPAASELLQESDFAPFKPLCDVLVVNAHGHAPEGRARSRFAVGLRIGPWHKTIQVTGPRRQYPGLLGWRVEKPQSTAQVPIRYTHAYGGTRVAISRDGQTHTWVDERNPSGAGHAPEDWVKRARPNDLPAPQLEVPDPPYRGEADYPVVGLGPIPRHWLPRRVLGGTFDEAWKETVWPRLPADHDYRYWNSAPEDQQIPYPAGGEAVQLAGLTASGAMDLTLPTRRVSLRVRLLAGPVLMQPMNLDTLEFDMQAQTLACVFRATVPAAADVRKLELGTWEVPHGG